MSSLRSAPHTSAQDPGLERLVEAQDAVFEEVCSELAAGRKINHWMWFVFPQVQALGRSVTAKRFGLEGRSEALACGKHPVLGPRLKRCTELVLAATGRTAHQMFGAPDDLKLRSCMTLFDVVASGETVFDEVLRRYFQGQRDGLTLDLLDAA